MTTKFDILQLGHPQLRQPADVVDNVTDPAFQSQLDDLFEFVMEKGGMGIAAPQVGISQQFFILSCHPNERYPYAPEVTPFAVINPTIIETSAAQSKDWEGCLSLPGIRGLVPRYDWVKVRYSNRDGDLIESRYDGFLARVFQHELDHLQGTVFLDRVETTRDVMMEQEWRCRVAAPLS